MNLAKLFKTQKGLREHINYNGPDRKEKLILALLVEVGECTNEWRGFKFWSTDQEPRTKEIIKGADGGANVVLSNKNPLLEEYVDGLHFILELGLEIDVDHEEWRFTPFLTQTVTEKFTETFESIIDFKQNSVEDEWIDLFEHYLGLGEMLGFTWNEIETAYFEKNKVNHQRQLDGY